MTRPSKRGGIAVSICVVACWLGARPALACGEPLLLLRPHTAVIGEARQIAWAEATGSQPMRDDRLAGRYPGRKPVRYALNVLRVLKGQVGPTIELAGLEGDPSEGADTTFANHNAREFWKERRGRLAFGSDCSMFPPTFIIGRRYLVILGAKDDQKQFERVDNEDDRWLKYVARQTARRR